MKKVLLSAMLLIMSCVAFSQNQQIESAIKKIIKGLENSDASGYIAMYDEDVFKAVLLKDTSITEKEKQELMLVLDQAGVITSLFKASFHELLVEIIKDVKSDTLNIKYIRYEIEDEEIYNDFVHMYISVYVEVNGQKGHFSIYLSRYKGSLYVLEPLSNYFILE